MAPLKVGLTGGIGAGKSTVARVFGALGVPAYDADSRAKTVMTTDGILVDEIKKEFGTLCYQNSGELNRTYLASLVFSDPLKLNRLNQIVHPRVQADFESWVNRHAAHPYVLKEAALLFEAGTIEALDAVMVVTAPEHVRRQRALARDPHRTAETVNDIMKNQWPEFEKTKRADFVIVNDESVLVIPQVLDVHRQLMTKA
jgi:dephospho-CoA kinase